MQAAAGTDLGLCIDHTLKQEVLDLVPDVVLSIFFILLRGYVYFILLIVEEESSCKAQLSSYHSLHECS